MSTHALPRLRRLTPVLIVDRVEACIGFWTERLGFAITNQVPGTDGTLIFASAEKDGLEVMLQTRASVIAERADAATEINGHSIALFVEVDDLDTVEHALAGVEIVKPRHRTFYGSSELYVREPGGNVVGFAQFG